jgi:hypothetical protein
MLPLPDLPMLRAGKQMQRGRLIVTDQVSAKPSSDVLSIGTPCPIPWKSGKLQRERKYPKSKSSRARDLSDLAGTKHHVTGIHTKTRVNVLTLTRQTVNMSQWTLMLPILLPCLRNLPTKNRAQYRAEGRCFRCRTQGHMACNCPKNANAQNVLNRQNVNVREASAVPATNPATPPTSSSTSSVPPPPPPKLSYAQQIRALEAKMSDEEQLLYLNARDMGEDFCSAGL